MIFVQTHTSRHGEKRQSGQARAHRPAEYRRPTRRFNLRRGGGLARQGSVAGGPGSTYWCGRFPLLDERTISASRVTATLGVSPAATALTVGTTVAGRYRILGALGAGGMGTVYLAEHLAIGRRVALKVLSSEWAHTTEAVRRFRAEARAASAIGHPNIVEVFDADELPDGRPFLVMELVEGRHLLALLSDEGAFAWPRACRIIACVARALAASHAIGIIHRDLKAENVMLVNGPAGEVVKVLDFGIAVNIADGAPRATRAGVVVGTPDYMSPEQARAEPPTPAFDIYACGTLLFELICGVTPFTGSSPLEVLGLKLVTPAPSIASKMPDLPLALIALVDACLASDPLDRPDSAAELADRLEAIISGSAMPAPIVAPEPRGRGGVWVAGLLSAGVVGIAGWLMWTREVPTVLALTPLAIAVPALHVESQAEPAPPIDSPAATVELTPPLPGALEPTPPLPTQKKPASKLEAPRVLAPDRPVAPEPTPKLEVSAQACLRARREADDARAAQDWHGVLRHSADAHCWPAAADRLKLRVKANMELTRFSECVRLGENSQDVEVVKWVLICRKRLDAGG